MSQRTGDEDDDLIRLQSEITSHMAYGANLVKQSDATIVYTNSQFDRMFGYGPGELIGSPVSVLNAPTPRSPEDVVREIIEALSRDGIWSGEFLNVRKDGSDFWSRAHISRFKHRRHGDVWCSVQQDITEQKHALEALRRSEASFRSLVERSPDAILVRRDDTIVYTNRALLTLLGYSNGQGLVGQQVIDVLIAPADRASATARKTSLEQGSASQPPFECRWLRRDGVTVTVECVEVRADFEGEPSVVVIARDVNERKKLQERILMTDRLASLGTLAGGVAHEINNPLHCIKVNLDLLAEDIKSLLDASPSAKLREMDGMADDALDGVERIRKIVRALSAF